MRTSRIVQQIADVFPGSTHLKALGLKEADDSVVWAWAQQRGFSIVSKDTDFCQRAVVFGYPPKFIWLRVGNCPTSLITIRPYRFMSRVAALADVDISWMPAKSSLINRAITNESLIINAGLCSGRPGFTEFCIGPGARKSGLHAAHQADPGNKLFELPRAREAQRPPSARHPERSDQGRG